MWACATSLHSNPLSHTIRPFILPPLRRLLASPGLYTLPSDRYKRPAQPVLAHARRSSSSMDNEAAVASPADLLFKAPLEVVKYPDPILRAKNKRVNMFDESLKKLVYEMFDVMYRTDGIGLSAPQVGINVELMVFNLVGERGEGEEIVLVNPRIKRYSSKIVPFNEGCLSFPGIYGDVQRPDALQVHAQDIAGASFEVNLTGLPARVFQHEYDHLQMGFTVSTYSMLLQLMHHDSATDTCRVCSRMLIRVSSVQYVLGLITKTIPEVQSNYKGNPITSSHLKRLHP